MFPPMEIEPFQNQSVMIAIAKQRAQIVLEYIFKQLGISALSFNCYQLMIFPRTGKG